MNVKVAYVSIVVFHISLLVALLGYVATPKKSRTSKRRIIMDDELGHMREAGTVTEGTVPMFQLSVTTEALGQDSRYLSGV